MAIILQSSVSGGFSAEFMRRLPLVERAMIARGLEPSEFVISKDRASPSSLHVIGPFFFDYTVSFGQASFTVTEPNDMRFLDYFYQRCTAEDDGETTSPPAPRPSRPGLLGRLVRWMAQPI